MKDDGQLSNGDAEAKNVKSEKFSSQMEDKNSKNRSLRLFRDQNGNTFTF